MRHFSNVFVNICYLFVFVLFVYYANSRYYRWNREKMLDEWMTDQDKISKLVGLESKNMAKAPDKSEKYFFCFTCCDDRVEWKNTFDLGCNHLFCNNCWKHHLTAQMEKGPRVVYVFFNLFQSILLLYFFFTLYASTVFVYPCVIIIIVQKKPKPNQNRNIKKKIDRKHDVWIQNVN